MTDEIKVPDAGTADNLKLAAAIVIVVAGVGGYYLLASQPTWMRWLPVIGSLLLAGGFLAVGSCMSALTRNQVIAFILAVVVSFVLLLAGCPAVLDWFSSWLPQTIVDAIASLSFQRHFDSISKGVIDIRDILYFGMLIGLFLLATAITLDVRKAE